MNLSSSFNLIEISSSYETKSVETKFFNFVKNY